MKKVGLICITLVYLVGCSTSKSDKTTILVDPLFEEYLNSIPTRALPIDFSCGIEGGTMYVRDLDKYKRFLPTTPDRIFGRIKANNRDHQLIIFGHTGDDIYPTLFSFDNQGMMIDSLSLILSGCGGADDKQIPHSIAHIGTDLTINLVDTIKLIHYPEFSSDYVLDSIRIERETYKIGDDGRFVKQ